MTEPKEILKFVAGSQRKKNAPFCPCGKSNDDGKFAPFENYKDKGKCFSCGDSFYPDNKDKKFIFPTETEKNQVPSFKIIDKIINNFTSNFHAYTQNLFKKDLSQDFEQWGIGTNEYNNVTSTCFVLRNICNENINIKYIKYNANGRRDKNINPHYVKNCKRCLFGLHLYNPKKPIILIESEKSAFLIGLYLQNEFNVLATGGANICNEEMLLPLLKNEIYYFCDNDEAGKENNTIKNLKELSKKNEIKLKIIAPFENEIKGYDIGDYMVNMIEKGQNDNFIKNINDFIKQVPYFVEKAKKTETGNNLNITPTKEHQRETTANDETIQEANKKSKVSEVKNYLSLKYDFRKNIFTDKVEYKSKKQKQYKELNISDLIVEIWEVFAQTLIGENIVKTILESSFVPIYNPIHDYFENLQSPSNTSKDYINELSNFIEFDTREEKERFKIQFKKFFVRSIAQTYQQHINKQCLVLVGEKEDTGKSTFLRFLMPTSLKEYYSEYIDFNGKDDQLALNQNFIINIDELKSLNKEKANTIKSFFSMENVKLRKAYGRNVNNYKRYANFVGSTNNHDFLVDGVGSVRWLCFGEVIKIDFSYKQKINIDNVWWQAYQLYKNDFNYEVSQNEKTESNEINKKYEEQTDEDAFLLQYFEADEEKNEANFITSSNITLTIEKYLQSKKLNSRKMGKSLTKFNFPKGKQYIKDKKYNISGYYAKFKV